MKRAILISIVAMVAAQVALADVIVRVDGLSCATPAGSDAFAASAWTIGATSAAGKQTLDGLTISKAFDDCSGKLLVSLPSGKTLARVELTVTDPATKAPVATVVMRNARVTSYSVDEANGAAPGEMVVLTADNLEFSNFTPRGTYRFTVNCAVGSECRK